MAEPIDVLILAARFEVRGSSTQTLNIAEHMPKAGQLLVDHTTVPTKTAADGNGNESKPTASKTDAPKPGESKKKPTAGPKPPVSVRVVCLDDSRLTTFQRESIHSDAIGALGWPIVGRLGRRYFLNAVIESPPDVIHVQGLRMHGVGRWLANQLQRPYVITLHRPMTPRDRLRLDPVYGRNVIATSEAIRDSVVAATRIPHSQVTVIRNGVVPPDCRHHVPILDRGHRAVIGTAGPLEAGQGLTRFLRAIPRILAGGPAPLVGGTQSPEFLVAGAGPDERHLRRLAHDLGIQSKTTFVSNLYDFSESLSAMDLFCLPVERPGMGITMLQAMARGVPVIATDVGDVSQVITDGVTGLVIPPSDDDAIVTAVTSLLRDVNKARQIGAAAQELVLERYPLDNMLVDMFHVYKNAVEHTQ